MKKVFLISLLGLFIVISANAQLFQYGVKAGVNFSSLAMEDITDITDGAQVYDLVTGDKVQGYQIGIMTRVNVAMFFVQPELYYNLTGGLVEQLVNDQSVATHEINFKRIDIPLLVGAKLGPARLNFGPVGSMVLSSVNELQTMITDLETVSSGMTWGYQAGIGVDLLKKLAVDLRYEGSLSQYGDSFEISGSNYNFDSRPTQVILTVGWWF